MKELDYINILSEKIDLIYSSLENSSLCEDGKVYWITSPEKDEKPVREDIYGGISGILLFLKEYYLLTKNESSKSLLAKSSKWLLDFCKKNPSSNYAFYTGRIGTVYSLLQIWELLDEPLIDETLDLIKGASIENNKMQVNDLLNGLSGTILGLLHIYNLTGKEFLKKQITSLSKKLIRNIKIDKRGIFWDSSSNNTRPLCGISHGNSGIGFVLIELGIYFNNALLVDIAKMALKYEDQYFNKNQNNWPDFRTEYNSKTKFFKSKFLETDTSIYSPRYVSAWCHGAPGIGLVRMRAYEQLRIKKYRDKTISSGENIIQLFLMSSKNTHCLCHGTLGSSALFFELYRRNNNVDFLKHYINTCLSCANSNKYIMGRPNSISNDPSLFLGLSGIGYSFIQAIRPYETPSVLLPTVDKMKIEKKIPELNYSFFHYEHIKKQYPLSYKILNLKNNIALKQCFRIKSKISTEDFSKYFTTKEGRKIISFEKKKNALSKKIDNYTIRQVSYDTTIQKLDLIYKHRLFNDFIIKLNPDVKLLKYENNSSYLFYLLYPDITDYKVKKINGNEYNALIKIKKQEIIIAKNNKIVNSPLIKKMLYKQILVLTK